MLVQMLSLKIVAVFVLCCSLGANAQLQCIQGQSIAGQPVPGFSNLTSAPCPGDGSKCHRFDIEYEIIPGTCLLKYLKCKHNSISYQ